ncbi:MAG: AbrB/MazE/SpoVT family DNA-binding domain-containing protein [Actinobacteria bacterium]|nr:AbrB/MazE/SpoVT family DNA-binding domain-containing protein [Actinomycetota bacterium]
MAHSLRIGAQGRLVLPSAMRRELGIEPGDQLAARIDGRRIVLELRRDLLREMQEELRGARGKRSLVDELIAERRDEAARERSS